MHVCRQYALGSAVSIHTVAPHPLLSPSSYLRNQAMFSQYNYGQQGASSANSQTFVQQASLSWNGQAWVPSNPPIPQPLSPPPPTDIPLPPCPPHMTMPDLIRSPLSSLISHFSLAYQYFDEQAKSKSREAETTAVGTSGADELKRQAAWHRYHADLAARYAHHYNNFQTSPITVATSTAPSTVAPLVASINKNRNTQTPETLKMNLDESLSTKNKTPLPPASFQRFAHRCLSQCENDIQRASMEKQIASTIETAIKEGYMQTKNWDIEPELPIKLEMTAFLGKKLIHPSNTKSNATSTELMEKKDLPESFQKYVSKCLVGLNDIQRVSMTSQLKKVLEQAQTRGDLYTRNWEDEPELTVKLDMKAFLSKKLTSAKHHDELKVNKISNHTSIEEKLSSTKLPESFRRFVQRSLEYCDNDIQRASMESQLNKELEKATKGGYLQTRNWDDQEALDLKLDIKAFLGKKLSTIPSVIVTETKQPTSFTKPSSAEFSMRNQNDIDTLEGHVTTKRKRLDHASDIAQEVQEIKQGTSSHGPTVWIHSSKALTQIPSKVLSQVNYGSRKVTPTSQIPCPSYNSEKSKPDLFVNNQMLSDFIPLSSKLTTRVTSSPSPSPSLLKSTPLIDGKTKLLSESDPASTEKLNHRANRFSGKGGLTEAVSNDLHSEYLSGTDKYMGKTLIGGSKGSSKKVKLDEKDYEMMTVKGLCTTLEKEYLRLTAPPRAELVRPQPVLEGHLQNLKHLWSGRNDRNRSDMKTNKGNCGPKDYAWFCSQLKAIRQDLTVQRIINSFTVDSYETHARMALEEGDLNEYNQCQTKLKELYDTLRHSLPKTMPLHTKSSTGLQNESEFIAYRIIYYCFLTGNKKYDGGSSDIMKIMKSLTPDQRLNPFISHAMKVREAVASDDYHSFFCLLGTCPNKGIYLMDAIAPQMRAIGLQRIVKSYRPSIDVLFVCQELGLGNIDAGGWLESCGCKLTDDLTSIITKDTMLKENELCGKRASSLI